MNPATEPEASDTALREPDKIFYQQSSIRRLILSSYWIVILLAVPLWWRLTSITRLSLPVTRVLSEEGKHMRIPLTVNLDLDDTLVENIRNAFHATVAAEPARWQGLDVELRQSSATGALIFSE